MTARGGGGVSEPATWPPCRACRRALRVLAEVGWECECGVVVCADEDCVAEYFKFVAGGEGTRCLSCGALL